MHLEQFATAESGIEITMTRRYHARQYVVGAREL